MATFTYCPSYTLAESHRPRVRKTELGDGYEQRIRMGLNSDPKAFDLTFENRTDSEAVAIEEFLESNGGSDSFTWTPPARLGGNRLLWSEEFDNAAWFEVNVTVNANTQAGPFGAATADTIVEGVGFYTLRVVSQNIGVVVGQSYVLSVYAKQGVGLRNLLLTSYAEDYAIFNIATGNVVAVGSQPKALITNAGNGWWRCSATITKTNTNGGFFIGFADGTDPGVVGNGTSSLHLWGAQVEPGSSPTDYRPTTNSMVGVRDVPGKYVCEEWDYTLRSPNNSTIQAKFRQVFEY